MHNDKLQITISKIKELAKEFDGKVYVTDPNIFRFDKKIQEDAKEWHKQKNMKNGNYARCNQPT